jgi:hypothetical protein
MRGPSVSKPSLDSAGNLSTEKKKVKHGLTGGLDWMIIAPSSGGQAAQLSYKGEVVHYE